ncbi:hypothetical protein GA0074695_2929 [Micromonospora viridifaciens]|uniref:Uncharacterized protein n=1 Tax=Micromonospora viridifaciens TaxID=1881 RepID=A0A1C4X2J4_MICVI|nr:hypothetical protein [Micromonospora viridifaciens]SCF02351.1 hypothetical protein GA0074695_2929 [Micromonospora viridifaciens]
MPDLCFSSYAQTAVGRALRQVDPGRGPLASPTFRPGLTIRKPDGSTSQLTGPDLAVLGAGAVVGLDPRALVRTDPPAGATEVEPNYLASVELAPVELPWLLTPARPGGDQDAQRLRPWLVLVVVVDRPGVLRPGRPLPVLTADVAELPDLDDSWAWAHVQQPAAGAAAPPGLPALTAQAVARLVCPRQLHPSMRWLACLVPAFAGGRAAGLGLRLEGVEHAGAWDVGTPGTVQLPVYASWSFATGEEGDFEHLVRRLRPLDKDQLRGLGVRMVNIATPWAADPRPLAGTSGPATVPVCGALRSFADTPPGTAPPGAIADLRIRLRAQLNAPAARLRGQRPDGDATGAVAPPIYGGRHLLQDTVAPPESPALPIAPPDWVSTLNFDVAARIAAGVGAEFVRTHQEDLMAKAWEQVGAIREANACRRVAELGAAVAASLHRRHVTTLEVGEVIALAAPAAARARTTASRTTLATETVVSTLAGGAATSTFARLVRPCGPVARAAGTRAANIVSRGLAGQVTVPAPTPLIRRLAGGSPPATADALGTMVATAVDRGQAGLAGRRIVALQAIADVARADGLTEPADLLQAKVSAMTPDISLARAGRVLDLARAIQGQLPTVCQTLSDTVTMLDSPQFTGAGDGKVTSLGIQVDPARLRERIVGALRPEPGIAARVAANVSIPPDLLPPAPLDPVMAYPRFPIPTALALLEQAAEWFLPGIGQVPGETAALLQPNPVFIESFLVGLAEEMNRELRWRGYPTDLRGTPFDTFWPRPEGGADIPPIHTWRGGLGTHLDAQAQGLVVLLVRGTVVRRFPDMVVAAVPGRTASDSSTWLAPLFLIPVDSQTAAYVFGLNSNEVQAEPAPDDPGWYFAFQEHGYRLRFGFDDPPDPPPPPDPPMTNWNQLNWSLVPQRRGFVYAGDPFRAPHPTGGPEDPQWGRDAADIARIALQQPFRVLISARRLVRS